MFPFRGFAVEMNAVGRISLAGFAGFVLLKRRCVDILPGSTFVPRTASINLAPFTHTRRIIEVLIHQTGRGGNSAD